MSVRARAAAFAAGTARPIAGDAPATREDARARNATTTTTTTTTTRDDATTEGSGTRVDASTARARGAATREEGASGTRGDAARFERAFEKACDALALARAIEATVRRETVWTGRSSARERARARSLAAERAYEAVAERPGVTVDAKRDERARPASSGRTTATAREEEDTSMSVVRSFSFARDDVDGDDGDVGDADADEDEPSREAFEDDGGESGALREIARARREIASLLADSRSDAARGRPRRLDAETPAETRTVASPNRRVEKTIVMDRIAMIDGILAALAEDR